MIYLTHSTQELEEAILYPTEWIPNLKELKWVPNYIMNTRSEIQTWSFNLRALTT